MVNVRKFIIDNSVFVFIFILILAGLIVIGIRYFSAPPSSGPVQIQINIPEEQRFAGSEIEFWADGQAEHYQWYFEDDGTTKEGQTIRYVFIEEGDYKVVFTPNKNESERQELTLKILPRPSIDTIPPSPGPKVLPVISGPSTVTIGQVVEFTETSGTGSNWRWDFGDGNTYSGKKIKYTFRTTGYRTVQVFVDGDNSNPGEKLIRVNPRPDPPTKPPVKTEPGGGVPKPPKPVPPPRQRPRISEAEFTALLEKYATENARQDDFLEFLPKEGFGMDSDIRVDGKEKVFRSFISGTRLTGKSMVKSVSLKYDAEGYISSIEIKTYKK